MHSTKTLVSIALCLASLRLAEAFASPMNPQAQEAAPSAMAKRIGAIKAIEGSTLTLTPDSGSDVNVTVSAATRIVRIAPGEKSLKNATPIQMSDLQVGDRVLIGGKASDDAKSLVAASIVVMKHSDLEARNQQASQDWQKRGFGGLVTAVDVSAATVTISVTGFAGTKTILVRASKDTVIRRYAPDSVKFDDAKLSTLQDLHPGDQLRARGNHSPDGAELTAEEIVSGSFRNVAGIVSSVDTSASTIIVQDVLSKKPVQVKVTSESQLHKLPSEMAQHIAMRLKATVVAQPSNGAAAPSNSTSSEAGSGSRPGGGMGAGSGNGMRSGAAPDFQQMLSRLPPVTLKDLNKGDAVMIVTTPGTASGAGTVITLIAGVEPILQAAPSGSQAMMLSPWTLGGPSGDSGNQ
ncbi:MAG: hypothetical protein DMG77_01520 [Acidobacteria bacterium]|nr:MAG: hypothetical protein DMG77_01520 [Acidobacteriota bacterium]